MENWVVENEERKNEVENILAVIILNRTRS
jgi:hypothetical protein